MLEIAPFTNDCTAVVCAERSLTYRELNERANKVAARLKLLGVGADAIVGISMDRCLEMVVALVGVLRAGGAYLPLDPSYPEERLRFMCEDAQPVVVVSREFVAEAMADASAVALGSESNPDDLAYVIYTSGSTGKPKGVTVTREALANLIHVVTPTIGLTAADVVLATTTISFDISAFEIFAPLTVGARLVVARQAEAMSGEALSELMKSSDVTVMQATPSGWRILLESGWQGHPGLKMLTAGEALDLGLARQLLERGESLWNLYGPTEATIYATGKEITRDETAINIGKPLQNYSAWVLDDERKPVLSGVTGELYLGGVGLARGYLNRPELTAEKFVASETGERLYRTGDLARALNNGEIELLGRVDNQIKLRGYRIELGEVEAALQENAAVKQAVVKVEDAGQDDQRLVAYVLANNGIGVDESGLRKYLFCKLPSYMVPARYVEVDKFELTPSGKVDRGALHLPTEWRIDNLDATNDNLEDMVLQCWRSVLQFPNLDGATNFFAAGGHSLLAARVTCEIGTKLNREIPMSWILEAPTARGFAQLVEGHPDLGLRCVVNMQPEGTEAPIYFVHPLVGEVLVYRALAACFAPNRPVFGIQTPADYLSRKHPYSITQLASEYLQEVLRQQRKGPIHLAGYSTGAPIAFEMARQLRESGHEVGLLGFIDGWLDTDVKKHIAKTPRYFWKVFARMIYKIIFRFRDEFSDGIGMFVRRRIGYARFLMRLKTLEKCPAAEITMEQALRLSEKAYRPEPYAGKVLMLRFRDEGSHIGPNPLLGWDGFVLGGIEIVDMPGGHTTGMDARNAPLMAAELEARMKV